MTGTAVTGQAAEELADQLAAAHEQARSVEPLTGRDPGLDLAAATASSGRSAAVDRGGLPGAPPG